MSMNHKTWGFAKTGRNMDPSWFSLCTCISWPIADGNQAVPVLRIWEYEISVVSGLRTNLTYNFLIRINNFLALNRYCFGTLNWKIVALSVTHMNDRLVKRSWHKHVVQHFFIYFPPIDATTHCSGRWITLGCEILSWRAACDKPSRMTSNDQN